MNTYYKLFLPSLIVAITFLSCNRTRETLMPDEVPVKVVVAEQDTILTENSFVGNIEASSLVFLSFGVGGNVNRIFIEEGQKVAKGQLLATLDSSTAISSYNLAKAQLDRAVDGYERAKKVYDNGSLSEVKWVEIQTSLSQAQSMAEIAEKNVVNCNLYAPSSGVITEKMFETGMNVLPYQSVIKLMNVDNFKVAFSVPENKITDIKIGQSALVSVSALNISDIPAKVIEIGIVADRFTHSYTAKLSINNSVGNILPGMICKVLVDTDLHTSGIVIPSQAVQLDKDGKYVWLSKNSIAVRQQITIGDLKKSGVIVTEGLSAGDKIIVSGFQKVCEGTKLIEQ